MVDPEWDVAQVTPQDIVALLCLVGKQGMSSRTAPPYPAFEANSMPSLAILMSAFVPGV